LSFELSVRRGVPCTIIDPRPSKLSKKQLRVHSMRETYQRKLSQAGVASPLLVQLRRGWETMHPGHLQQWFTAETVTGPDLAPLLRDCSLIVGLHPDGATDPIVDTAIRLGKPFCVVPCCVFPRTFPLRRTCGHTATTAQAHAPLQVPMKGGGDCGRGCENSLPVRRYDELLLYLGRRAAGSETLTLGEFEGRNTAVVWHPPVP